MNLSEFELLEIISWRDYFQKKNDPVSHEAVSFLNCWLNDDYNCNLNHGVFHNRELLIVEKKFAKEVADYLENHQNEVLSELAELFYEQIKWR